MSSGFITESEISEIRKRRQEEWDSVRKADDPLGQYTWRFLFFYYDCGKFLERPEEPYDCRSLFERLQEQKQKKELEYEEAHKLSMYLLTYMHKIFSCMSCYFLIFIWFILQELMLCLQIFICTCGSKEFPGYHTIQTFFNLFSLMINSLFLKSSFKMTRLIIKCYTSSLN